MVFCQIISVASRATAPQLGSESMGACFTHSKACCVTFECVYLRGCMHAICTVHLFSPLL